MALPVVNSYDNAGILRSVLPREGIDIGPAPDFWGDLDALLKKMPGTNSPARTNPAVTHHSPQSRAFRGSGGEGSRMPRGGGAGGGGDTPQMRLKVASGFNMVPGYIPAAPWDPSGAFAGYAPPGFNPYPSNSQFVPDYDRRY